MSTAARDAYLHLAAYADAEYERFAKLEHAPPRSPRTSTVRREGFSSGRLQAWAQMAAHCRAMATAAEGARGARPQSGGGR